MLEICKSIIFSPLLAGEIIPKCSMMQPKINPMVKIVKNCNNILTLIYMLLFRREMRFLNLISLIDDIRCFTFPFFINKMIWKDKTFYYFDKYNTLDKPMQFNEIKIYIILFCLITSNPIIVAEDAVERLPLKFDA